MEWWNDGMMEWWNDGMMGGIMGWWDGGMMEWWNIGFCEDDEKVLIENLCAFASLREALFVPVCAGQVSSKW